MDIPGIIWSMGQVLSVVVLLAGAWVTLVPAEVLRGSRSNVRAADAGPSAACSACRLACDHWRYDVCHSPCNHRLYLEAEW